MTANVWIATGNPKKRVELERLLQPLGVRVRGMEAAPGPLTEVVEDQPDFAGNARKKAAALARAVGEVAVGDDSGLSVDALDGRPGVLSARYAGPGANDGDRITKLLDELRGVAPDQRTARFTCSIALCGPDGEVRAAVEEHCQGRILDAPRGAGGFGYDPIFVGDELSATGDRPTPTFAELSARQKDAISHRGKALRALAALLRTSPQLLSP